MGSNNLLILVYAEVVLIVGCSSDSSEFVPLGEIIDLVAVSSEIVLLVSCSLVSSEVVLLWEIFATVDVSSEVVLLGERIAIVACSTQTTRIRVREAASAHRNGARGFDAGLC